MSTCGQKMALCGQKWPYMDKYVYMWTNDVQIAIFVQLVSILV